MKEDEIRRLVKIVEESNIGELEISRWGRTIKISKIPSNSHYSNSTAYAGHAQPVPVVTSPMTAPASAPVAAQLKVEEPPKAASAKTVEIKAPMVGTFHRSPAPDADPYVDLNQVIKKGQVICIIEAMKLMNEIEAEFEGRVVEILVQNGQPVEYNQPLFKIEQS